MANTKLQNLWFLLSLVISLFFLHLAIPSQLPRQTEVISSGELSSLKEMSKPTTLIPHTTGAIRFKTSGEDPLPPDEELRAYIAARSEFERRFGHPYDEAWFSYQPIHYDFPVPEGIEDIVNFWIHVFGKYEKDQYIFHHKDDVRIVYSVIDLRDLAPFASGLTSEESESLKNQFFSEEKARIKSLLKKLYSKQKNNQALTDYEKGLTKYFEGENAPSLKEAYNTGNIRIQGGFSHRFRESIEHSGQYLDEMENIFSMKGLPVELTRLPLIESSFKVNAVSSADAVGIWQFIPDTGRRYLKIDEYVDERRDPILSTYAAAQHLENEYKLLGSWPLTINAYNTGPGRMLKAMKDLDTDDIAKIINEFKDPGYQFYSKNYYPEFVAALHVYENEEYYFGGKIERLPPVQYDVFLPAKSINLRKLADEINIDPEVMAQLNPGIKDFILQGETPMPGGYIVRVPHLLGGLFASAASKIYEEGSETRWHMVAKGENLESIADFYGLPVQSLEDANFRSKNEPLPEGLMIVLPRDEGVALNPDGERPSRTQ